MTVYTAVRKPIIGVMARLFVATGTPNTGAVVQDTWRALPSAASQYALGFGSVSPLWSINTSTGVLTYSGPQRQFVIHGSITLTGGAGDKGFSFSHSAAAIIGGTSNSDFEIQSNGATVAIAFVGAASIAPGDTIQGAIRNLEDTTSMNVQRYQLEIMPA